MSRPTAALIFMLIGALFVFPARAQERDDSRLTPAQRNRTGTLRELIPGYYVFSSTSFNSGVIATHEGVVVLDALTSEAIARQEREAIASQIKQPVRFLVSSTFHNNYTWGNVAFPDVVKIGHEDYRTDLLAQMQRDRTSSDEQKARLPQITFRDRLTIHLGGKEIQVLFLGKGHTRGDSIIFVPQDRIAYVSELYFSDQFLYINDGYGVSWLKTLDAVEALPADIIVPGHGPIPQDPKETRQGLHRFRQMLVDLRDAVQNEIKRGATKIRLNQVDGPSGPALSSRLMGERRAGKYQADLYIAGQGTHVSVLYPAKALAPMPPAFIMPEVKDASKWFKGKHRFVDPEARHSFVFQGHRGLYVSVNTQQAKTDEIKSWWDLLNPKWKGKIIGYDPTVAGVARNVLWYLYMNKAMGPDFINKLYGDMQITLSRDHRQLVDWLAAGKAALCVPCDDAELSSAREQRLPVDSVTQTLKEGDYIAGGQGVISLIAPAPHPHAAQIFLNWFLSREGQSTFQEQSVKSGQRNANSRRTDIAKDVIAPQYRLKDDAIFWENGPNVDQETAEATKLLKAILAKRP